MGRINKFLLLCGADRRLLVRAFSLVFMIRVGLWVLPFSFMRKLLVAPARSDIAPALRPHDFISRAVWAVTVASTYVPLATCLTQALVTRYLLAQEGCNAVVRIGVARSRAGRFQAHAWVESNGRVVIGGSESVVDQFTELRASDGGGF
jgi:hypothetical protein